MVKLLSFLVLILPIQLYASDIKYTHTDVSDLRNKNIIKNNTSANSKLWNVTEKEWTKYESIMKKDGKYHWRDVDPIMILGMYAESESDKKRYAIRMAKKEHRLTDMFASFNRLYQKEFDILYGHEKILDLAFLKEQISENALKNNILSGNSKQHKKTSSIGDKYILFISSDCQGCSDFYNRIVNEQAIGSSVDIYFIRNTQQQIRQWAKLNDINPELVKSGNLTLNLAGEMYDRYNRPAIPSAFYFDKKSDTVLKYKLD